MCEPKNRLQILKSSAKRLGLSGNIPKNDPSCYRHKNHEIESYQIHLIKDDEVPMTIELSKYDKGQVLMDKICHECGVLEKDYFGFRYIQSNGQMQWLNLRESVHKQLSKAVSTALSFRVKHYPGDPIGDLRQDVSRDLIFHQIRRDLICGRILCPAGELAAVGALILREKFGDPGTFKETLPLEEEWDSRFDGFKVVFNQTQQIEMEILKKYKALRNISKQQAKIEMLQRVSKLPTYGTEPFPIKSITNCKDPKAKMDSSRKSLLVVKATSRWPVYVGPRYCGLTTYVGHEICDDLEYLSGSKYVSGPKYTQDYTWENIERLDCEGKHFIVYLKPECDLEMWKIHDTKRNLAPIEARLPEPRNKLNWNIDTQGKIQQLWEGETQIVRFHCKSRKDALNLWRWTVDHWNFFTLKDGREAKTLKTTSTLFHKSHSHCFTGRTQMELKSLFATSVWSVLSSSRDHMEISPPETESSDAFCQLRQKNVESECVDSGYSSNCGSTRSSEISSSTVEGTDLVSCENFELEEVAKSGASEVVTPEKEDEAATALEPAMLPVSTTAPKDLVLLCTDIDAVPVRKSRWPYIESKRMVQELNPLDDVKATDSSVVGSGYHEAESAISDEQVSKSDSLHLPLTVLLITSALVVVFFRTVVASAVFSPFGN